MQYTSSSASEKHSLVRSLLVYSPVLIAVLIMLPRLFSPQFGLFDDGKSIITAQQISHGDWSFQFDAADGRFRPVYWLSFALVYRLFGSRPVWFFMANTLVFAVTAYSLIQLILNMGQSRLQAGLSGLAFALAAPIVENYYTLSKGEPWQVMFLALSLLAVSRYGQAKSRVAKAGIISLVVILQLLAHFAKETSVVVAPIALAWYLAERLPRRNSADRTKLAPFGAYLVASLVSTAAYLLMRLVMISSALQTQGYTSRYIFTVGQIIASTIRWAGWLVRDFAYLVPLGIAVIIIWTAKKKTPQAALINDALVWSAAWIVVFMPWYFMAEYYMLPATFGLAILVGAMLTILISTLGENVPWIKWLSGFALGVFVLLFLSSLLNSIASAHIQLSVDTANAQMLRTLADSAPSGSTVFINIQDANEYVDQIAMQLPAVYDRPDLVVKPFNSPDTNSTGTYYIVEPQISHQPLLTVRMGVFEPTQISWNGSLQSYFTAHPGWQETAKFEQHFHLSMVDLPRLLCPMIKTRSFCATPAPVIETRLFAYGWKVYQLVIP